MSRGAVLIIAAMTAAAPAWGETWPGWRGPHGDGISREQNVPLHWGANENIAWKVPVAGKGHSSPVVTDDSIYLSTAIEEDNRRVLMRLDRETGKTIWERTVLVAPPEHIHPLNSRASSTPTTDGKRIFVTFLDQKEMFVAAYDAAGNKQWEQRPGPFASVHGFCTCPVIYQDKLIVNGDHDGESYIAMLRQEDGSVVWKTPREKKTRSYCTPIIANIGGKDQLMLNGSFCTAGYDAATGKKIWTCDGPSEQMVATLVRGHGLIFSLGGYPERHLLAIKEGAEGDVTNSHVVWRTNRGIPYVPSPLLYGDWLHVVSDEGIYTCFEPKTGSVETRRRISDHVSASLIGACNRVYAIDDKGKATVFENGPKGNVLAENELGEEVYSTPAISDGKLFIRGAKHLYCIGNKSATAKKGSSQFRNVPHE